MQYPPVLVITKKIGETPLEALEQARKIHHIPDAVPMTYAGRLDPMAEGLLIVLVGEECKVKEKYLNLEKEYETEIVFGISTDTYDALGIPVMALDRLKEIEHIDWNTYIGTFNQEYPPYSSKTVEGKPLFSYAREGSMSEIEIPTKEVEIFGIQEIKSRTLTSAELLRSVQERISKVSGDFRQQEILRKWEMTLTPHFSNNSVLFSSFTLNTRVSSGTYIRSLANRVGKDLGTGAFALSIKRQKIGKYRLGNDETVY